MVNEEKVRIMTAIAHEEKEHGSELLNDAFFYKNDYVKMHVLSVIWNYTIGYFLILILIALYNMDYLLLNFVKINYLYAGMALLFSYLLIIIVSVLISKIYYQDKYDKEQETLQKYHKYVLELKKFYVLKCFNIIPFNCSCLTGLNSQSSIPAAMYSFSTP